MLFSMKTEKQNKLSFLDVGFIRKQGKSATTGSENLLLVAYVVT